jgi:pyruvate,water dikinase
VIPPGDSAALFEELKRPELAEVDRDLLAYLEEYAWMADDDEILEAEHWGENPNFPLTCFARASTKASQAAVESVALCRVDSAAAQYAATNRSLVEECAARPGRQATKLLEAVEKFRAYLQCKEQVHVAYVRLGYYLKLAALELGRRVGLAAPAMLLSCSVEQLQGWLASALQAGPEPLTAAAVAADRVWLSWRNFEPPYEVGGAGWQAAGEDRHEGWACEGAGVLQGRPCASGRDGRPVTGRVRVARHLDECHMVQADEILVVPYTSPAWTPLFSVIKGLVMEHGGSLSHGAVVARECGLPAVCLPGATTRLRTGSTVRLDGVKGTIAVIEM